MYILKSTLLKNVYLHITNNKFSVSYSVDTWDTINFEIMV
jgi:hypothetical protein